MPRLRQRENVALLVPVKIASSRLFHVSTQLSWGAASPTLYIAKANTLTNATTPRTMTHPPDTTPEICTKKPQAAECNTTTSPLQPDLHWIPFFYVCFCDATILHRPLVISYQLHNEIPSVAFVCRPHINDILQILHLRVPSLLKRLFSLNPNCILSF